jgi:hypothetical protein
MTTIVDGTTGITFPSTISGVSATQQYSGRVLQVVQGTYSTETETSSGSFVDTGLSVSITPTSSTSKILAILNMSGVGKNTNNTTVRIGLVRSSTNIGTAFDGGYNNSTTANYIGSVDIIVLDSPATTSSTTYKAQFLSAGGNAAARIGSSNSISTLTLMEIAA